MSKLIQDIHRFFHQIQEWESTLFRCPIVSDNRQTNRNQVISNEVQIIDKRELSTVFVSQCSMGFVQDDDLKIRLQQYKTLEELYQGICDCQNCPLGKTRTKFVFGSGSENAKLIFIGEAPGEDEDLTGLPFVGRAGKLLTKILTEVGIPREQVYICNVLKCRPPKNRDPLPEEVIQCEPFLKRQIEILQPKLLVSLGRISAQLLLNTNESLAKLKKVTHYYFDTPLMVTFHPAYVLRNMNAYSEAVEDMRKIKDLYNALGGSFE
ncbi:MAG: uracil-DNA glycosylase [bacterium]|nr:uracil-DNA glycosylase [bacterium]